MSQELPSNKNTNEEVDLIVFFNLIGNALAKVVSFFTSLIKSIFSVVIHTIKIFINNWKVVLSVIIIASILGYGLEKSKPVLFQSEMLVKPYFESKFQLVNNISYFNALIKNKNHDELNKIFNSDSTNKVDVKNLKHFKIEPGPETENDRVLQYQSFIKELDSIGRLQVDYDKFIENRSIYSGNIFLIIAKSNQKDIFKDLAYGINSAFTNEYSNSKKVKDTLLFKIQQENIQSSLSEIAKLKDVYIKALQDQASNPGQPVSAGEFMLTKEKDINTKEYDLLDKELRLKDQLRALDEKRVIEDVFVDVVTSFQPVGHQNRSINDRFSITFPLMAFMLLCLLYVIKRIINYAKNYDE